MDESAPAPDLQDEVSRVTIAHGVEAMLARAQALENEQGRSPLPNPIRVLNTGNAFALEFLADIENERNDPE